MVHELKFAGYTFPGNGLHVSPTFGDVVTRTGRLPGLSGGFDEYGIGQAPNEIGNITLSFTLIAAERDDMQAKRNAVAALTRKGVQQLRWKPDGYTEFLFCNARVSNIRMPQDPSGQTDLWQTVSMNFQVADPHWYSYPFDVWYFDGDVPLDGEMNFAGWAEDDFLLDVTVQNNTLFEWGGTADVFPRLTIATDDQEYRPFTLQRVDENLIVQDEITILETLDDAKLVIDCRKYTATWHTVGRMPFNLHADWIGNIRSKRAEFMRIQPGINYFRVVADFDWMVKLKIEPLEAWR